MNTTISKKPSHFLSFMLNIEIQSEQEFEILRRIFNKSLETGFAMVNDPYADHAKIDAKSIMVVTDSIHYALQDSYKLYQPDAEEPKVETDQILQKPPKGLIPMQIWMESRTKDIWDAICIFQEAGKEIPDAWQAELEHNIGYLQSKLSLQQFIHLGFDNMKSYLNHH